MGTSINLNFCEFKMNQLKHFNKIQPPRGSIFFWEGRTPDISRFEWPCFFIENGVPKYLYGATQAGKAKTLLFNIAELLVTGETKQQLIKFYYN